MVSTTKAAALFGSLFITTAVAADTTSDTMGAGAFVWPPDRAWIDGHDEIAPCGSTDGVGERTPFPLTNGKLALVAQDATRAVHISVSYKDDPKTMDDFETFYGPNEVGSLDLGHTCINAPDAPSNIRPGMNATFGLLYVANFEENPAYRTIHYACADVTFVEFSAFDEAIPCFNATTANPEISIDEDVEVTTTDRHGNVPHTVSDLTSKSSSVGLSTATIAGAVVGSVAGLSVIAAVAFWLFRRNKKRSQLNEPMRQVDAEKANNDTLSTRS
ncbi:hypothetical protein SODALDRAFT_326193 [Sodiomyces alkalinus F11]|uniref:Copper acquisition factor BIM1-like domain-containing protein n=1 Tax=Sodiomyces alkalinus (strain CBS 110278 / VKM F-3762 / F11) TaxID=1314773 RepID=A0A3N2Q5K5_SODAK|nr:hypothetical protein SODALDRAFT_326193 [Sodiomyces alkalinus F11]ROT42032.1 hypothetical protein SODALDRAFT_326193 [Sodiomyces alkalinus F11]